MANRLFFNDIVKGRFGRRVCYTNAEKITEDNILKVVSGVIGTHNLNKTAIKYLHDYYLGDQPVLYRVKTIRDDIVNKVVENRAYEIVSFKVAQTYGEPIQFVSLVNDADVNKSVDRFNDYERGAGKAVRSIKCGEWQSSVGTGFQAVGFAKEGEEVPYKITTPTPLNTFVIYSSSTEEPLLAVQELKDEDDYPYLLCFSDTHEFRIQNSKLVPMAVGDKVVYSKLHAFGGIPIVEFPNNQDRLSDIELVISMLDSINNMQSNRMDAIEQFVQSWVKFVNCEIDEEKFQRMKMNGALVVTSNNGEGNKADVEIMSQELNQTQSQVAKDDLWDSVLSISAIPNKQGNTGGDTQGAVELRNGWDFSKSRAKLKDPFVIEAEKALAKVKLNIIRIRKGDVALSTMQFEPQINHSPQDNMQVKAQVLSILLQAGIHPLIAIKVCGLWGDAEKTYLMSKPFLDVLYKTIEDTVPNAEEEEVKAKAIMENVNRGTVEE